MYMYMKYGIILNTVKYYIMCSNRKKQHSLLRHDVVRVYVSFCVLVFIRAILSWNP